MQLGGTFGCRSGCIRHHGERTMREAAQVSKLVHRKLLAESGADKVSFFGHEFKPMTDSDWDCFAGADEGSLICYVGDERTVLIFSPASMTIVEMICSNDERIERTWKMVAE